MTNRTSDHRPEDLITFDHRYPTMTDTPAPVTPRTAQTNAGNEYIGKFRAGSWMRVEAVQAVLAIEREAYNAGEDDHRRSMDRIAETLREAAAPAATEALRAFAQTVADTSNDPHLVREAERILASPEPTPKGPSPDGMWDHAHNRPLASPEATPDSGLDVELEKSSTSFDRDQLFDELDARFGRNVARFVDARLSSADSPEESA